MDDAVITVDDDVDAGSRFSSEGGGPDAATTDKEIEEHRLTHLPFRNYMAFT